MSCPQCQGIEQLFNDDRARQELKDYRRNGPNKTTRLLIEALKEQGVGGMSVLDIGGGVGAIQTALLKEGAERAISVDASAGYTAVAREEAEAQGLADRIERRHGNFVEMALELPPADIVTLDRVICCYHDMPALVGASAGLAARWYGVVYPRDTWWFRLGAKVMRLGFRLMRNPMRFFVHPAEAVEAVVRSKGLERRYTRNTLLWQVIVYGRG